jgi:hypothetical protein
MTQAEQQAGTVVAQWRAAIAAAQPFLARHAIVEVAADSPGWVDSGVELRAGETLSLLCTGAAALAGGADIRFNPQTLLWRRIRPGGKVDKLPAASTTFSAGESGRLELVVNFPGAWQDPAGGLDPAWPRQGATGAFQVAVLVWQDRAEEGLACMAAADRSGSAGAERARVLAPAQLPRGWQPLWRVGATEVYSEPGPGQNHISCRCSGDGGIIKYPLDLPLERSTRLAWSWRMIELPSKVKEDVTPTHDYLSIAVEFDNGLDLTYLWSAALPVGTVFRCPLPWWDQRETHQVVRSGSEGLGRWVEEEQPLLADYERAIGGPAPARIVGVWLIAVAILQRGRGECDYRGIELRGAGGSRAIGPVAG